MDPSSTRDGESSIHWCPTNKSDGYGSKGIDILPHYFHEWSVPLLSLYLIMYITWVVSDPEVVRTTLTTMSLIVIRIV